MNIHLDQLRVCQRLEKAAATYDKHAVVQKELGARLLERMTYIKHVPTHILDLSLHPADSEKALRAQFPKATYIAATPNFNALTKRKSKFFQKPKSVCIPFGMLPFKTASVDFVVMNITLLWTNDWPALLRECRRVLIPNGLFLFTTLGPDTLHELRQALGEASIHNFVDMHDIGDAMVTAGFENPVMDMEHIKMQYSSQQQLFDDLRLTGSTNARQDRKKSVTTPHQWKTLMAAYPLQRDGSVQATFEFVYGHAFAGEHLPQRVNEAGEIIVPLEL